MSDSPLSDPTRPAPARGLPAAGTGPVPSHGAASTNHAQQCKCEQLREQLDAARALLQEVSAINLSAKGRPARMNPVILRARAFLDGGGTVP